MDHEYLLALIEVRQGHMDLTVEASCPGESLVEDVGAVGGGKHYDSAVGVEAVHFRQKLVESVLALII